MTAPEVAIELLLMSVTYLDINIKIELTLHAALDNDYASDSVRDVGAR